jgi:hypothetical protein
VAGSAPGRPPFFRLTVAAGTLLTLDALFLGALGLRTGRPALVWIAAVSLAGAGLLFWLWRLHRERWAALAEARRLVQDEARSLAELVRVQGPDRPGSP